MPHWPFQTLCAQDPEALAAYRRLLAFGQPPEKPWLYDQTSTAPARVQRAQVLLDRSCCASLDRRYEALLEKCGSREAVVEYMRRQPHAGDEKPS